MVFLYFTFALGSSSAPSFLHPPVQSLGIFYHLFLDLLSLFLSAFWSSCSRASWENNISHFVGKLEVSSRYPKTKFSAERKFICPRGTGAGDKRKRQAIEDEGEDEGIKGGSRGIFQGLGENKRLLLDRGETDMTYRKIVLYKGKGGNPVLG